MSFRRQTSALLCVAALVAGCGESPRDPAGPARELVIPRAAAPVGLFASVAFAAPQDRGAAATPRRGRRRGSGVEDKTKRDFDNDCMRSGCHASLKEPDWIHAPVAVGACGVCHQPTGKPGEHRFEPTRPKETACSFCHRPPKPEAHIHKVFSDGDCESCHDPHGGASRSLLHSTNQIELCGRCHDATRHAPAPGTLPPPNLERPTAKVSPDKAEAKANTKPGEPLDRAALLARQPLFKALHEPIREGKCLDCHKAHQSQHDGLLLRKERELCAGCHEETLKKLAGFAHRHEPVDMGCLSCHGGHGGATKSLLKGDTREACLECHQTTRDALREHPDEVHGAITADLSCLTCHQGHGAETKSLTPKNLRDTCMTCHDKSIELDSGRRVASLTEELQGAKFFHGPVEKGECQSCHRSHTSDHASLLTKAHSNEPYIPYSDKAYELCFSCHDKKGIEEEKGTTTAFRDGTRNLHYLHVRREKGRSCNLCHATHASKSPKLLREEVDFGPGGWKLPIAFRKTEDGGSCGPGCHKAFSYSRKKTTTSSAEGK